jgi:hypothetical protein
LTGEEIAPLIAKLSSPDLAQRERAAAAIFDLGVDLARPAVSRWLEFPALANLFVRDARGEPQFTVGLAVRPDTFDRLRHANGALRLADAPADQDAQEFELEFHGVRLDILTTRELGGGGAIDRFLERFGEGIQQVEILVTNVDRATEVLKNELGVQAIYPATRPGADGTRINFFLVPAAGGRKVLIELFEKT